MFTISDFGNFQNTEIIKFYRFKHLEIFKAVLFYINSFYIS